MTSNKARINIEEQGGQGQGEPATLEKEKGLKAPAHSLPGQGLQDKDHHKILYDHIPLHNPVPSASLHARLFHLSTLTPPSGTSVPHIQSPNPLQCTTPPPYPPKALSPLDFPPLTLIPFPLLFSTANCYANKLSALDWS